MNDKVVDVKNEVILSLAHRMCYRYKHMEEDRYRFSDQTIIDFVRRIMSELDDRQGTDNKDDESKPIIAYNAGYESGLEDGLRQASEINGVQLDDEGGENPIWTQCAAYLYDLNLEIKRLNNSLSEALNDTGYRSGIEKCLGVCRLLAHNKYVSPGRYEDEVAGMEDCIGTIEGEIERIGKREVEKAKRNGKKFQVDCPKDCLCCTGEYCDIHYDEPCDCDCIDRHVSNSDTGIEN